MRKLFGTWAIAVGILGAAASAQAVPIKWTLTGVTFNVGGTATGSFVYDADSGTYSNISISTTPGTTGTPKSFSAICSNAICASIPTPSVVFAAPITANDLTNVKLFYVIFGAPLPDAPGTATFVIGATATCQNSTCSGSAPDTQAVTGGTLVGTPFVKATSPASVPTLNQWSLMLLASLLGGLVFWRQRRKS